MSDILEPSNADLQASPESVQNYIADLEARLADNQTVIDASDDLTAAYLAGYGAAQKRIGKLEEALRKIAYGEGIYGAQAYEYKQIARAALKGR